VIRHDKHATTDHLASLAAGALSRRKAARISAHLAACDQCGDVGRQLDGVPAILASVQYPPMPATLSIRIEASLRVEATKRLTAMPATEAGRGDLPARHRRRTAQRGWHMPGLSVPATRLVAAAGALTIVAVGGYEIASHTGTGGTASPPAASAVAPAQVQQMSVGPEVTYGRPGDLHTIHSLQSNANFAPDKLSAQVVDAVHAAQARGLSASEPTFNPPGTSRAQAGNAAGSAAPSSGLASRLAACINLIAPGRVVVLVDQARFEGTPATIIVIAALAASPAEAWVVGSGCSAASKDILGHVVLGHL
jgi:hypothetical protein